MNTDEQLAELAELRSDPRLSELRYDEIIALRMFLLDIQGDLHNIYDDDPIIRRICKAISKRARTWGKKGDCV